MSYAVLTNKKQPSEIPPSSLAVRCENTQPDNSHEPFCFELFRRAIVDRSSLCWHYLHNQYYRLVRYWVSSHAPPDPDTVDDLTQEAFTAFWRFYTADKLARARGLGDVLAYLKTCAASAVIQLHRKIDRAVVEMEWDEQMVDAHIAARSVEKSAFQDLNTRRLWAVIVSCCHDDRDRLLARLLLLDDLKPRQIVDQHPEVFPDVSEVYRIKRNLFDRLRRNPILRAMCEKR